MKKSSAVFLFGIMSFFLGAIVGAIIWVLLKIINLGIDVIWSHENISIWLRLSICLLGGLIIGLWQRKNGILPHDTEQVFEIMKNDGRYPYDRLAVISVSAILPLIFGGALGPEAGLTGIIAGLCYWVGDSLKSRGDRLAEYLANDSDCSPEAIAETGISVVFSIVFRTPLAGIAGNLERNDGLVKTRKRLVEKKTRIFLYCMGVVGGMLAVVGLGKLFGLIASLSNNEILVKMAVSGGLPRFSRADGLFADLNIYSFVWFIPLVVAGMALGFIYKTFDRLMACLSQKITKYRIISCLIAGVCVALFGLFLPDTMFSGEHQLVGLIDSWQSCKAETLILTAVFKLILVSICINFGWRGGSIFPIIFSGSAAAFGILLIIGGGMSGGFAPAVLISAMYAYISRKPITSVLIMLLCVPVTYIIPMFIAAFVASKVPTPFKA